MRTAVERPDGSLEISRKIDQAQTDLDRYLRMRAGETVVQIAASDRVDVETVLKSCRKGRGMFEAQQLLEIRDLKHEGALETEKIRRDVREKIKDKLIPAVEKLLEGKRQVAEVNKVTGQVTIREFDDPDVITMGIEQARKLISLDEKPSPQTLVQIQQNNVNQESTPSREGSFEERLTRIRQKQAGVAVGPADVIETTVRDVTEQESSSDDADERTVDPPAETEGWSF